MSIFGGPARPKYTLYQPQPAYEDPRPIGHWRAVGTSVGDLTGGYVGHSASPILIDTAKYLWSLEGVSVSTNAALANGYGLIKLITGEPLEPLGISQEAATQQFQYAGFINIPDFGGLGHDIKLSEALRRIHQPDGRLTPSYQIFVDTNVNGTTYTFVWWGYIWHPQARTRAGGPMRPL